MAKEVCEYYVIKDGSFTVKKGQPWDSEFELHAGGKTNRNSVLYFRVDPYSGAANVNLEVKFGTNNISFSRTYSAGQSRTEHEVINPNILDPHGQKNHILFHVPSGAGKLRISDVVLFYRLDV
ncbi:MAG: hypothetical protein JSV67_04540 [Thermoplasmatales archaeon]|nr:MAG: hypothetical protein JSV67_04540 [Thermoplasmatales archaeon]